MGSFKLTKIPLEQIVNLLTLLYEEGYDYFDLEGEADPEGNRDVIKIAVREEYHSIQEDDGDDKLNFDDDYEKLL